MRTKTISGTIVLPTSKLLLAYMAVERLLIDARRENDPCTHQLEDLCFEAWDVLGDEDREYCNQRMGTVDERNPLTFGRRRATPTEIKAQYSGAKSDCTLCKGVGWNWSYTPEYGPGDTKITCICIWDK